MTKMLVLCPTRERPENAERLNAAFYSTCGVDTDLVFLVDDDDPRLVDYVVLAHNNPNFYFATGESKRLGPWLNDKAIEYGQFYDIVGFMGDDVIPRTLMWDKRIKEAMVPNGVVYADDGFQGENLPTSVFMDARMVEKAGYMVSPELVHLYIDNHWKAWGEALGTLRYLPYVHLEHMHPHAGKADDDRVYRDANSDERYDKDSQAFDRFVMHELPELVQRLG